MSALRWATLLFPLALSSAMHPASPGIHAQNQPQSRPPSGSRNPSLAHRPPPQPGDGAMRLDVLALDRSGAPVSGLPQTSFTLLDNRKPLPLLSFQEVNGVTGNGTPQDPPVELILLIDAANNALTRVAYERYEIEKFLRQNGGHLTQPVSLMLFAEQGTQVQPTATRDGNLLAKQLDSSETMLHEVPRSGGYDAIERMQLSVHTLMSIAAVEERKPGRKLLIWIGPGWPMLAGMDYQNQANRVMLELFNTLVELTGALQDARMTMYAVNPVDPEAGMFYAQFYRNFLDPPPSARKMEAGDLAVPVLAIHSGGLAFDQAADLVRELNICAAEAGRYYTLRFRPPAAGRMDEYHALAVKLNQAKTKARTISGYYSQAVAAP